MPQLLCCCKTDSEPFLLRELEQAGATVLATGPGWVRAQAPDTISAPALCFCTLALVDPQLIETREPGKLVDSLVDHFCLLLANTRLDSPWPLLFDCAPTSAVQIDQVRAQWLERARKRMSRVIKLATQEPLRTPALASGFCVLLEQKNRAWITRSFSCGGQLRMKDNPEAPSRSFLKIEEAYGILGREPAPGETVVDLGAAPGGWSYSAALLGAQVYAVDNGPLKGGALGNSRICHCREDAFGFNSSRSALYDWLFCDMVEDPYRILELVGRWIEKRWCHYFIVNLKYGRTDPVVLLQQARLALSKAAHLETGVLRQLYHDREEITIMGALHVSGS